MTHARAPIRAGLRLPLGGCTADVLVCPPTGHTEARFEDVRGGLDGAISADESFVRAVEDACFSARREAPRAR